MSAMRIFAGLLGLLALMSPARAEWRAVVNEDPFNGDQTMAIAYDLAGYGVAFRCTKADDLALVYLTPEKSEGSEGLALVPAKLLVIVDTAPKVELDADMDVAVGDTIRLVSEDDAVAALAKAVMGARRRVAVAVEIGGKTVHAKTFDVRGTGKALTKLASDCKLP